MSLRWSWGEFNIDAQDMQDKESARGILSILFIPVENSGAAIRLCRCGEHVNDVGTAENSPEL